MRAVRWLLVAALAAAAACRSARVDADHDGVDSASDCDDSNPAVQWAVTAYPDADGDGVGAGTATSMCVAGLPRGWAGTGTDCAPGDASAWRTVTSPLADRDGDGWAVVEGVTLCVGAALPAPYVATSLGLDCDDTNPALQRWVALYADQDGDGVGACPRAAAWTCIGAALPAGFAAVGCDPDDGDPAVTAAPLDDTALSIVLD